MFNMMAEIIKDQNANSVEAMTAGLEPMNQAMLKLTSQGSSGGGGKGLNEETDKEGNEPAKTGYV